MSYINIPGEISRTFKFGKIDFNGTGRRINAVEITISLRRMQTIGKRTVDGVPILDYIAFSASGPVWNGPHTDHIMGGQCLEDIAKFTGQLSSPALFRRILALWRRWHLNDMNAGTRAQREALDKAREASLERFVAAGYKVDKTGYGYRVGEDNERLYASGRYFWEFAGFDTYYNWCTRKLEDANLFEAPFGPTVIDETGEWQPSYKYGSRWLVEPLTPEALAEIEAIFCPEDAPLARERFNAWLASEAA